MTLFGDCQVRLSSLIGCTAVSQAWELGQPSPHIDQKEKIFCHGHILKGIATALLEIIASPRSTRYGNDRYAQDEQSNPADKIRQNIANK